MTTEHPQCDLKVLPKLKQTKVRHCSDTSGEKNRLGKTKPKPNNNTEYKSGKQLSIKDMIRLLEIRKHGYT